MERYQGELLTNGGARGPLSPSTVHSYVRVVNQMLVWARDPESGVEDEVPGGKVRLPKLGGPVKDILSREEIERLEDTARTERDKLIIRVFSMTLLAWSATLIAAAQPFGAVRRNAGMSAALGGTDLVRFGNGRPRLHHRPAVP